MGLDIFVGIGETCDERFLVDFDFDEELELLFQALEIGLPICDLFPQVLLSPTLVRVERCSLVAEADGAQLGLVDRAATLLELCYVPCGFGREGAGPGEAGMARWGRGVGGRGGGPRGFGTG